MTNYPPDPFFPEREYVPPEPIYQDSSDLWKKGDVGITFRDWLNWAGAMWRSHRAYRKGRRTHNATIVNLDTVRKRRKRED